METLLNNAFNVQKNAIWYTSFSKIYLPTLPPFRALLTIYSNTVVYGGKWESEYPTYAESGQLCQVDFHSFEGLNCFANQYANFFQGL